MRKLLLLTSLCLLSSLVACGGQEKNEPEDSSVDKGNKEPGDNTPPSDQGGSSQQQSEETNLKEFVGLTYESKSVKYDGLEHINDVKLVGVLPEGTNKTETKKNSLGNNLTSAIEVGTYYFSITLKHPEYKILTLNATLTIKGENEDMPVFCSNSGSIYFSNGLDSSRLYSISGSSIKKVSSSTPKEFYKYDNSSPIFIDRSVLNDSVKQINGESVNVLFTESKINDFVKQSDSIYYFSCNSLKSSKSGIYKVDASNKDEEPVVTKVFTGKSDNLALYNNNLYFCNGEDKDYIYKLSTSTSSSTPTLVIEQKVHEYVIYNNVLYATANNFTNDYIGKVNLSGSASSLTKLTNDAGEYLKVRNGFLYYNCNDWMTKVDEEKKGIYRIDLSNDKVTQVLQSEEINGFDVESTNSLVYNSTTNLHLYRYNMSTKQSTDLLSSFQPVEETPLNTGGKNITISNKIYYLNMYAGKTLYLYDENNGSNSQLTTNKVEDFYIYSNTLYFNQVTMFTNNDIYKISLSGNEEAEKICSNDMRNMVTDGNYLYGTHYNFAGVSSGIARMNMDGTNYIKFSEVNGAKNLQIRDGKLYYINCGTGQDNGNIEYISLSSINSDGQKLTGTNISSNIKNVKQYIVDGNNLFYIYNGTFENSIRRTDFSSLSEGTKIASTKTNPNEILIHGDYVYYYTYASTNPANAGFCRISKTATSDQGGNEPLVKYDNKYYGSNLSISSSNKLYFLNYIVKLALGDAHFYSINLSSKAVSKIA